MYTLHMNAKCSFVFIPLASAATARAQSSLTHELRFLIPSRAVYTQSFLNLPGIPNAHASKNLPNTSATAASVRVDVCMYIRIACHVDTKTHPLKYAPPAGTKQHALKIDTMFSYAQGLSGWVARQTATVRQPVKMKRRCLKSKKVLQKAISRFTFDAKCYVNWRAKGSVQQAFA